MLKIKLQLFNPDGSLRWDLVILEFEDKTFKVFDDAVYSLFDSDQWEFGKTPGEALDNFIKAEQNLIDNL